MLCRETLRVAPQPLPHGLERPLGVGGARSGEDRIPLTRVRVHADFAAGKDRFGESAAGLERALVFIGPHENAAGVPAARAAQSPSSANHSR